MMTLLRGRVVEERRRADGGEVICELRQQALDAVDVADVDDADLLDAAAGDGDAGADHLAERAMRPVAREVDVAEPAAGRERLLHDLLHLDDAVDDVARCGGMSAA